MTFSRQVTSPFFLVLSDFRDADTPIFTGLDCFLSTFCFHFIGEAKQNPNTYCGFITFKWKYPVFLRILDLDFVFSSLFLVMHSISGWQFGRARECVYACPYTHVFISTLSYLYTLYIYGNLSGLFFLCFPYIRCIHSLVARQSLISALVNLSFPILSKSKFESWAIKK